LGGAATANPINTLAAMAAIKISAIAFFPIFFFSPPAYFIV
jgi:hypothetical protein